ARIGERVAFDQPEAFLRAAVLALAPQAEDARGEFLRARAGAQRGAQVGAARRVEARVPEAVGRQARAITGTTEGLGGRSDDPEALAARQSIAFRRRHRIAAGIGLDLAELGLDRGQDLGPRDD